MTHKELRAAVSVLREADIMKWGQCCDECRYAWHHFDPMAGEKYELGYCYMFREQRKNCSKFCDHRPKESTNSDTSELKHCPFCGGVAEFVEEQGGYYVRCRRCNASSKMITPCKVDVFPMLREAWNKRCTETNKRLTLFDVKAYDQIP